MKHQATERPQSPQRQHLEEAQELLQEARAQIAEGRNREAARTIWSALKKGLKAYTISRERPKAQ